MNIIQTKSDFLQFIQDQAMENGNLSIRGVARCCGVPHQSIINGGNFNTRKLGQTLIEQGFDAGSLVEDGFPPQAVWLTIEYFAYESKAKAEMAKQLARTFGSIGIMTTMEQLKPKVEIVAKPVRDTVDWVECSKYISGLEDPILKSALMQHLYEDLGAKTLPGTTNRSVLVSVKARELGHTLKPGQDGQLGKHVKRYIEPNGKAPHGRYEVNTYEDTDYLTEVVTSFFS